MAANTSPFQQLVSMKVHTDSINTIQFSPNGEYLATGGDDAHLFIFSSQTWKVQKKYMTVGPIRAIAWHKTPTGVVSFGIRSGIVITMILKNNVHYEHKVHGTIHCMTFDSKGKFIAVGFNNEVLIARQSSIKEDITCSVNFHTKEAVILVTYLHGGIVAYDVNNNIATRRWHVDVGGLCGDSALSSTSRLLATTVLFSGIEWYDMTNRKSMLTTRQPADNVILPIIFVGSNAVAIGSATGNVSIFKAGEAEATQVLQHHDNFVQALAYFHDERRKTHILVTGMSEQYEESMLTVWRAKDEKKKILASFVIPWQAVALGLGTVIAGTIITRQSHNITLFISGYLSLLSGWQLPTLWSYPLSAIPGTSKFSSQTTSNIEVQTQIVTKTVEVMARNLPTPVLYESDSLVANQDEEQAFTMMHRFKKPSAFLSKDVQSTTQTLQATKTEAEELTNIVIKPSMQRKDKAKDMGQVRFSGASASKSKELHNMLHEEVSALLVQTLPDTNVESLVTLICEVDDVDMAGNIIKIYLEKYSLDENTRQNLINGIVARILNYQLTQAKSIRDQLKPTSANTTFRSPPPPVSSHKQAFSSKTSGGTFGWYSSVSATDLDKPSDISDPLKPGDLFFHENMDRLTRQVWLYNKFKKWEDISEVWKDRNLLFVHPEIPDRVLTIRSDNTPNWILKSSLAAQRGRSKSTPVI
ncbi:WD40-repeat-containing domain protein [Mycena leptocephala]|nr:WD40-repeat-containing domain protein [Mycena leptocephala]